MVVLLNSKNGQYWLKNFAEEEQMMIRERNIIGKAFLVSAALFVFVFDCYAQNPEDAAVKNGQEYMQNAKYDEAITSFNKAIELNPNSDEAYHNRGTA